MAGSGSATTGPSTPTEELVAQVWRELLELEDFDLTEDFFELGGHSMIAVQVVYELEQRTGVPLELASFFDLATVPEVAAELDRLRAEQPAGAGSVLIEEGSCERGEPAGFASPAVAGEGRSCERWGA
ncbi:phosphopantetheine-binding protein [Plantactinospora sp. KBS50]|uniref:phosphopantetheine-binding protein n=1 Tax=Plantactinospora sp. KBS50 TaxID=2024580 RepID=UPI0012FDFA9A|nr:phosphopantetheine-binding protein [Plantactinospora sp. KBS50]